MRLTLATLILGLLFETHAQDVVLKGKILNANGLPIQGANVSLKKAKIFDVSNDRGEFRIERITTSILNGKSHYVNLFSQNNDQFQINGRWLPFKNSKSPAIDAGVLRKIAAEVDTLVITHDLYEKKEIMVNVYRDSLSNIVLEIKDLPWSEVVKVVEKSIYSIGLLKNGKLLGIGTGFAIDDTTIMTNAHVVAGLVKSITDYGDSTIKPVAVINGGSTVGQGVFYLKYFSIHPNYDTTTTETFDFGLVTTTSKLPQAIPFEADSVVKKLSSGQECASLGFPGELNPMNTQNPVATFKSGSISAVRAFNGQSTTPENAFFVQYNLNLSGGTSGSPIFNKKAKVTAINNSGPEILVYSKSTDKWERVPQSALDFGIRIDLRTKVFQATKHLFSELKPNIVTYKFINGSPTDLQIMFVNSGVLDTIKFGDTLSFWDNIGTPVNEPIVLKTIVATDNWLYWADTLITGKDFTKNYIVTNDYFFLQVGNSTNKTMKSVVVSSALVYDSSLVYCDIGYYQDVGFYKASATTNFRLYFYSATEFIRWDGYNTTSTTSYAAFIPLKASLVLLKVAALKPIVPGKSTTYNLTSFLMKRKLK